MSTIEFSGREWVIGPLVSGMMCAVTHELGRLLSCVCCAECCQRGVCCRAWLHQWMAQWEGWQPPVSLKS